MFKKLEKALKRTGQKCLEIWVWQPVDASHAQEDQAKGSVTYQRIEENSYSKEGVAIKCNVPCPSVSKLGLPIVIQA